MSNMDNISDQLFAKIRGRFPAVTIGNEAGEVTDDPKTGRYFDFDYIVGEDILGRVSITLTEKEIAVVYNTNFIAEQPDGIKSDWYNFLKEIRNFAKRNMLNFDTRDINKSNLDKRDYAHLTKTAGEKQMSEAKMYGTSRTSYEDIDKARLVLKHRQPVNQEVPGARTQHVEAIYIESENGERYKYPMRHLNGARALAQHVSNGGNLYDDFGKHIVSLSEELGKLKQFKTYINRSAVMAEGLKGYMDMVNERIDSIKTEVMKLQRPSYYAETIKDFAPVVMEEVPEDLQNSWIDELTIRTFNEELKSVFPYINRLVKEKNKIKEMGPTDFLGEEKTEELKSWYEKYKQYKSADADNLADGMFKFHLDSGVDLDTVEKGEYEALVKKHGEDKVSGNALMYIDEMPITNAMLNDFKKIMGSVDEETVEKASDMLDNTNEVSDMGMNKYGLAAKHKDGKFYSFRNGKMTGGPFDSIEELQKHQMELIQDEASGPEGGMEPHAHKFYIDGDYDEDRGISDKDCEEMEYACAKAGIKCKCEPDEMRQGGVIIHTMSPRDAVADALDKEGFAVEEAYSPEEDFESAMNMIVGETEDALVNGKGKDQEAAIKKLNGLTAQHFPAGINGTNAVQSLKGIIDDPMLLDMFKKVGAKDSDQCVRPLIMKYIKAKAPAILPKIDTGDLKMENIKDKEDYMAKKKAIQDLQMDPNTAGDERLKKEIVRRKHELEKEARLKGFKEDEDKELVYTDGMTADEMFAVSQAKIMDNDPSEEAVSGPMFVFQDIKDPAVEKEYDAKIKAFIKDQYNLDDEDMDHMFPEGEQERKFDKYGAMVSMPEPDDKMADLNDKMNQIKIADHLAKAAGVNRKNVYFDDADLVWGSKTVIPSCLVDKECTFADAVDKLKAFAGANPKAEDDDTIDVKMNPDGSIEKAKDDKRTPGEKLEELVKSYYDYTTNAFPKGETAVVTACEKEFGDKAIPFAEKMISRLKAGKDREMERIKQLAGV